MGVGTFNCHYYYYYFYSKHVFGRPEWTFTGGENKPILNSHQNMTLRSSWSVNTKIHTLYSTRYYSVILHKLRAL